MKRREVKSKGEKERYKHLNAEFQRIPRRHKKAFFSDQCKETEENGGGYRPWGHKQSDTTERLSTNPIMDLYLQYIEFCQENALVIANTLYQQHKRRLYIWTSPDGQH